MLNMSVNHTFKFHVPENKLLNCNKNHAQSSKILILSFLGRRDTSQLLCNWKVRFKTVPDSLTNKYNFAVRGKIGFL